MELKFLIKIPEKYVNLDIANNYRQETKKVNENKFEITLRRYPDEVYNILKQKINMDLNWPKFLEKLKDSIETYEDLFLVIKDYIRWKIKNEYKEADSPFIHFYGERWSGGCNTYNGLLKEILDNMGFETRFVAGLLLQGTVFVKDKLYVGSRHVWVDVKINNLWIELDATSKFSVFPHPLTFRLFDIKKKLKFEIDEWLKKEIKVEIL